MAAAPDRQTLYADICKHAQERPTAIAVIEGPRSITYAQFATDIDNVSRRLHGLNLPRNGLVAISVLAPYMHWLVLIGLWRIGVASVSIDRQSAALQLKFFKPQAVVVDQALEVAFGGSCIRLEADWLVGDDTAFPPVADPVLSSDQVVRLTGSSGTLGLPKRTAYTKRVMDARLDRVRRNPRFNTSICFMSLVGVMAVEFFFSVGAWSVGGSVEFFSQPVQDALDKGELKANLLFMNTNQLRDLVGALPPDRSPVRSLIVLVGGSVVPKEVYSKALQRLAGSVMIVYGSTEAGTVAMNPNPLEYSEPGVCGFVVPDMEVQVINDAGHPVGEGVVGEIRLRSTSCVQSYEDDAAATELAFKNGWFYPGDLGRLSKNGLLTVMGRVDEVINVGGWKVAPALIEEVLVACSGLRDIAVCTVIDTNGLDQVWVGVVKDEGFSQDALLALWQRSGVPAGQALRIIYVDAIPRNATGKTLRAELSNLVKTHRGRVLVAPPLPSLAELRDAGATIRVSGTDLAVEKLSEPAKACVASLQFVEAEMQRLSQQMAAYEKAKMAYSSSLNHMLLDGTILRT